MEKNDVMVQLSSYVQLKIGCVASVSSRGSSRKLGLESKKKCMTGEGEGEGNELLQPFFASALTFA